MAATDDQMRAYYEQGKERDRLAGPKGALEAERTKEILQRRLPPGPAVVADIGGGPGYYAEWLAGLGYVIEHRDIIELHVDQLRALAVSSIRTAVGDARELDLADASVDAVLLLGPMYHLPEREDRLRALGEARRVVRPEGPVFVAAINRWAPRLDGVIQQRIYELSPDFLPLPDAERTGHLPPVVENGFVGYMHRPGELADEISAARLRLDDLVGVEGLPLAEEQLQARMADPVAREVLLDAARAVERVPELLGLSPHLIATATRID